MDSKLIEDALEVIKTLRSTIGNTSEGDIYSQLISLRKTQRELQIAVEGNKATVTQARKKAEELASDLEAHEYSLKVHELDIEQCRNLDTKELDRLGTQTTESKEEVIKKLNEELERRVSTKEILTKKQSQLQALKATSNELASNIKKLAKVSRQCENSSTQLQETFGVSNTNEYQQLLKAKQLPEPLHHLYTKLAIFPVDLSIVEVSTSTNKNRPLIEESVQLTLAKPHKFTDFQAVFPIAMNFTLQDSHVYVDSTHNFHKWVTPGESQPYSWAQKLGKPSETSYSMSFLLEKLEEGAILESIKESLISNLETTEVTRIDKNTLKVPCKDSFAEINISLPDYYPTEPPSVSVVMSGEEIDVQSILNQAISQDYNSVIERAQLMLSQIFSQILANL